MRPRLELRRIRRTPLLLLVAALALVAAPTASASGYRVERGELRMRDGVALSATFFLPEPREAGKRSPVLLELLPYRKDDSFYLRDLPHHALWARRGFASVKVDVRGTGSSAGRAPDREYSRAELDDAVEIVRQLAAMPWSNGRVAMWGISWGGFNAYQVALRRPPGLAAIVALHASDDLYRDSIDWLDGLLHLDPYHLEIHHENGLPATPDYPLDAAYFRDRFDVRPWIFDHLGERDDGPFWRPEIRLDRSAEGARLEVPAYAIGAWLDGYRDFPFRLLAGARAPLLVDVGPWNHAWPHDGEPGPNYEWVDRAERFLRRFLVDDERPEPAERRLLVYLRDGHLPDPQLASTPGRWLETAWPVPGAALRTLHATASGALDPRPGDAGVRRLAAPAGSGTAAGIWWGEPTGDQRADDGASLIFDTPPLHQPLAILGMPRIVVTLAFDGPGASDGRVVARLEDVDPDGRSALVTGAALAARHRAGADRPLPVPAGEPLALEFDLHATSWIFRPGHRIRLALSTAQFPMLWPAAGALSMTVATGDGATRLDLPEIPLPTGPEPALPEPAPRDERADARWLDCGDGPEEVDRLVHDLAAGRTRYERKTLCAWQIGSRRYDSTEENLWEVDDAHPENARYLGRERHAIALEGGRTLDLASELEVTSDATAFHLRFERTLTENGAAVRQREWRESYRRP